MLIVVPSAVLVLSVVYLVSARHARVTLPTITSLFLLSSGLAGSSTENPWRYDLGGIVELPLHGKQAVEGPARLRSFLWTHWIKHKRGFIVTFCDTVDRGWAIVSYFVEPNEPGGDWRIVIEPRRQPHWDGEPTLQRFIAYDVKRIEPAHNGWDERAEIPSGATRRPESYRLSLKIEGSNEAEEL